MSRLAVEILFLDERLFLLVDEATRCADWDLVLP